MKHLMYALLSLLLGCSKELPPYSGPDDPDTGGSNRGGTNPPTDQFTITVRFYSSDSLMARSCMLSVDEGPDIAIKYSPQLPHCRDAVFESVTLMQEVEYIFKIKDHDKNKVIDTFHFREPLNGFACKSFNLKR